MRSMKVDPQALLFASNIFMWLANSETFLKSLTRMARASFDDEDAIFPSAFVTNHPAIYTLRQRLN